MRLNEQGERATCRNSHICHPETWRPGLCHGGVIPGNRFEMHASAEGQLAFPVCPMDLTVQVSPARSGRMWWGCKRPRCFCACQVRDQCEGDLQFLQGLRGWQDPSRAASSQDDQQDVTQNVSRPGKPTGNTSQEARPHSAICNTLPTAPMKSRRNQTIRVIKGRKPTPAWGHFRAHRTAAKLNRSRRTGIPWCACLRQKDAVTCNVSVRRGLVTL